MYASFSLILNLILGLSVIAQSQPRPCCCTMKVLSNIQEQLSNRNEQAEGNTPVVVQTSRNDAILHESLPPCCQQRLPASTQDPDSKSEPCRCRSQWEQGARVEKVDQTFRDHLLETLEFLVGIDGQHSLFKFESLDSYWHLADQAPDAPLAVRARLCVWNC
ncbi:hypothetical protein Pla110_26930 [Polystyrenella longa]|uniref:Uncharacterized protein n=1 Tax=Polystyrenella longa TaxID=2528007 RepID=A0A518CP07_9PLAN|nr:hypothetical protein [Polystyrenella longa]QDU80957.1 hypothetical protein Pla110_26930 [Polystyrenella longa]